jgi:hypothetical protein
VTGGIVVTFLTLFLGLVSGAQEIALDVSGPVTMVELRLGDQVLATLDAPPWVARCNLGDGLRPGRLIAIGRDRTGGEISRAEQLINVPTVRAAVVVVLDRRPDGDPFQARVQWVGPEFREPRKTSAMLDGERVAVSPDGRIELGGIALDLPHVLDVELEFSPEVTAREQLVFGHERLGEEVVGITAVPVVVDNGELPTPEQLGGWFRSNGTDLGVVAVERGPAQLVVVRDQGLDSCFAQLELDKKKERSRKERSRRKPRLRAELDDDLHVRFMTPVALTTESLTQPAMLFPISDAKACQGEDLFKVVGRARYPEHAFGPRMLADSVAVAALRASNGNRRRAVVLLLGTEEKDRSRYQPDAVRQFLADLHVPLHVWRLGDLSDTEWGDAVPVTSYEAFVAAVQDLGQDLARQRIVWVTGRHLPNEIELGPKAQGIALVR